ncbi:MAG: hypothetical protein N3A53_03830, partial [Verrucomicrobiae bacterium]|nr:hypothetical protein [Verrucomicrobiae bacterium]
MFEGESGILAELVQQKGLVTSEQLSELVEEHQRTGKPMAEVLMDFGILTEDQLLQLVADYLNIEYVKLTEIDIPPSVLRAMPASAARMYGAVPIRAAGNP